MLVVDRGDVQGGGVECNTQQAVRPRGHHAGATATCRVVRKGGVVRHRQLAVGQRLHQHLRRSKAGEERREAVTGWGSRCHKRGDGEARLVRRRANTCTACLHLLAACNACWQIYQRANRARVRYSEVAACLAEGLRLRGNLWRHQCRCRRRVGGECSRAAGGGQQGTSSCQQGSLEHLAAAEGQRRWRQLAVGDRWLTAGGSGGSDDAWPASRCFSLGMRSPTAAGGVTTDTARRRQGARHRTSHLSARW